MQIGYNGQLFSRIVSASSCEEWRYLKTIIYIGLIGDLFDFVQFFYDMLPNN